MSAKDKPVVWVGGDDDIEINESLSSITDVNASGMFTFFELAEPGRHASFAITNDSGPMHILACSGIPVYGLFGPTNSRRSHAVGQGDRTISAQIDGDPPIDNNPFRPLSLETISTNVILSHLSSEEVL